MLRFDLAVGLRQTKGTYKLRLDSKYEIQRCKKKEIESV